MFGIPWQVNRFICIKSHSSLRIVGGLFYLFIFKQIGFICIQGSTFIRQVYLYLGTYFSSRQFYLYLGPYFSSRQVNLSQGPTFPVDRFICIQGPTYLYLGLYFPLDRFICLGSYFSSRQFYLYRGPYFSSRQVNLYLGPYFSSRQVNLYLGPYFSSRQVNLYLGPYLSVSRTLLASRYFFCFQNFWHIYLYFEPYFPVTIFMCLGLSISRFICILHLLFLAILFHQQARFLLNLSTISKALARVIQ